MLHDPRNNNKKKGEILIFLSFIPIYFKKKKYKYSLLSLSKMSRLLFHSKNLVSKNQHIIKQLNDEIIMVIRQ